MPPRHPTYPTRRPLALLLGLALGALQTGSLAAPADGGESPSHLGSTTVPTQWWRASPGQTAPVDDATLERWWQGFQDPALESLIGQALQRNTDLRMAQATLSQAQAARAATEAGAKPQIGVSASSTRSRTGGWSSGQTGNQHQLAFSASWEPDLNGAQGAGIRAAQADELTAQADLQATRMSLAAEVGLAYLQWRDAEQRLRITRAAADSLSKTETLMRWRHQAGLVSSLDLDQARLNTEQTQASVPTLVNEVAQWQHQLAVLTGQAPLALKDALPGPAAAPADTDLLLARISVGVPADLLRRRPDLRAAETSVLAQMARRDQTRRQGWPSVSLSGTLGLQALTLAGLSASTAGLASLAGAVNWSLWDAGQQRALVAEQDAAVTASQTRYEAAVLSALQDVEDGLVALRSSRDRATSLSLATDAAERVLSQTQHRHAAGLTDTRTLLDAERSLLTLKTSLQTARTDVALNLVRLYKALGGGWSALPTDGPTPVNAAALP